LRISRQFTLLSATGKQEQKAIEPGSIYHKSRLKSARLFLKPLHSASTESINAWMAVNSHRKASGNYKNSPAIAIDKASPARQAIIQGSDEIKPAPKQQQHK
jgi:hypothetical protein